MKLFYYLLFIFISCSVLSAQYNKFYHITSEDGLAQNTVTFVLQDYKGFLWFGSYGGLNRYDGNKIKQYRNDVNDSTTLTSNAIKWIHEDRNKNLWIGCYNGGLHKYIRDKEEFISYPNPLDKEGAGNLDNILTIAEDSSGILWVGSEGGLCSFDPKAGKYLKHYYNFVDSPNNLNAREVFCSYTDSQNNLWLGLRKKFGMFNTKTGKFTTYISNPEFSFNYIIQDKHKNFWLSTINNGVIEFNVDKGIIHQYSSANKSNPKLSSDNTYILYEDDKDNIWIGTKGGGITLLDTKTNTAEYLFHDVSNPFSISNNSIYAFYKDRSGVLWIGTDLGANSVDMNKKQFKSIILYQDRTQIHNDVLISSIEKDRQGNFWFGTWGMGIYKYNPATKKIEQYKNIPGNPNSLSNNTIRYLYLDKFDRMWIATNGGGLNILDIKKNKFWIYSEDLPKSYLPDNVFNHIYEDRQGNIWIGAWHGGLLKCSFSKSNKLEYEQFIPEFGNNESIGYKTITRIFEDSKGRYWIATKGGGLDRISSFDKNNKPKFVHYRNIRGDKKSIASNEVMVIYEDEFKNIWIGTNAGGYCRYNEKENNFTTYTTADGLISNVTSGITGDDRGNLWIATSHGLSKFNIRTGEFHNYDFYDGLLSHSFLENSFYKDTDGTLYFGGDNGISYFQPDSIKNNTTLPQTVITDFSIFNQPVKIGENINGKIILNKAIAEINEIVISHKESVITIEFAALHFSAPRKNKFMYRLIGFDKNWRFAQPGRPFDTYTNLDPGEYLFQVKASNNDGLWNEQPASLKIIVTPPFYSTWWAYFFYASVAVALIFGFIKLKTRNQEKELEILRKADVLKSEFLAQMSHEIRSPINIVLSYSNLLQDEFKDKVNEDVNEYFTSINNAGKRIIRTIDMLLNMSEIKTGTYEYIPKKINMKKDVIDNIIHEYERLAGDKNLKLQLIDEAEFPIMNLDEYTVQQIFANLVDNAIKYTQKGGITVRMTIDEIGNPNVSVEDTGIGIADEFIPHIFDPFSQEEHGYSRRFEGNGLGLALVKKYCELNNASITVESKKGSGTKFNVKFHING